MASGPAGDLRLRGRSTAAHTDADHVLRRADPPLPGLTKLTELRVAGEVTDAGIAKLRQSLPNCKVVRESHRHTLSQ